ncbi:hypothetical protein PS1_019240 [Malus domestica]
MFMLYNVESTDVAGSGCIFHIGLKISRGCSNRSTSAITTTKEVASLMGAKLGLIKTLVENDKGMTIAKWGLEIATFVEV